MVLSNIDQDSRSRHHPANPCQATRSYTLYTGIRTAVDFCCDNRTPSEFHLPIKGFSLCLKGPSHHPLHGGHLTSFYCRARGMTRGIESRKPLVLTGYLFSKNVVPFDSLIYPPLASSIRLYCSCGFLRRGALQRGLPR